MFISFDLAPDALDDVLAFIAERAPNLILNRLERFGPAGGCPNLHVTAYTCEAALEIVAFAFGSPVIAIVND